MNNKTKAVFIITALSLLIFSGCGGQKEELLSANEETQITSEQLLKAMGYDPLDYVELGDYSDIRIEMVMSAYEVSDEDVETYMDEDLQSYDSSLTYESLDDETVAAYIFPVNGCETVDEYSAFVREELEEAFGKQYESDRKEAVLAWLIQECPAVLPEGAVEERMELYLGHVEDYAEESGTDMKTYLEGKGYGSEEEFSDALSAYVENELTKELILAAIIRDSGFSVTQEGFDAFSASYADSLWMDGKFMYGYYGGRDAFMLYYAENQVLEELCGSASVSDSFEGYSIKTT